MFQQKFVESITNKTKNTGLMHKKHSGITGIFSFYGCSLKLFV